jgi:transcriptional regulator with XRE-family HTH domain
MSDLGKTLRQAREAAGLSLSGMARRTGYSDGYLGNVETGVRNATPKVIRAYERVLGVDRRSILAGVAASVATATVPDAAVEIFRDIAAERTALLSTVQTTHSTDRAIGALVSRDRPCAGSLLKWARRGSPLLRVNSVGILAKVGSPDLDNDVVGMLKVDEQARLLYLTAVASRVLNLGWNEANELALKGVPLTHPDQLRAFSREISNPYDSGARWCSLVVLAGARADDRARVDSALQVALKRESSREMLRSIGGVLTGLNPVDL